MICIWSMWYLTDEPRLLYCFTLVSNMRRRMIKIASEGCYCGSIRSDDCQYFELLFLSWKASLRTCGVGVLGCSAWRLTTLPQFPCVSSRLRHWICHPLVTASGHCSAGTASIEARATHLPNLNNSAQLKFGFALSSAIKHCAICWMNVCMFSFNFSATFFCLLYFAFS